MWTDESGQPVSLEIISFFDFTAVGPVLVEQLKQAGIEATYCRAAEHVRPLLRWRLHRRPLRARRQLQLRCLLLAAPLPDCVGEDPWRPPRQLLALEQRGVRQARRRAVQHQPDRDGKGDGDLEAGPGDLAAGVPGHPDLAGTSPPADQHNLLDQLARRRRIPTSTPPTGTSPGRWWCTRSSRPVRRREPLPRLPSPTAVGEGRSSISR